MAAQVKIATKTSRLLLKTERHLNFLVRSIRLAATGEGTGTGAGIGVSVGMALNVSCGGPGAIKHDFRNRVDREGENHEDKREVHERGDLQSAGFTEAIGQK